MQVTVTNILTGEADTGSLTEIARITHTYRKFIKFLIKNKSFKFTKNNEVYVLAYKHTIHKQNKGFRLYKDNIYVNMKKENRLPGKK